MTRVACHPGRSAPNGTIRDECLNEQIFGSLAYVRHLIEKWRQDYNNICPHNSLGYQTPAQYRVRPHPTFVVAQRALAETSFYDWATIPN